MSACKEGKWENMFHKTYSKNYAFYLLRPSSRVHRYGVDKLWRNTADRGANWGIRRGTVIRTVLVLAVAGDATSGQSCRFVQGHCTGLDPWDHTQVSVTIKQGLVTASPLHCFPPAIPSLSSEVNGCQPRWMLTAQAIVCILQTIKHCKGLAGGCGS